MTTPPLPHKLLTNSIEKCPYKVQENTITVTNPNTKEESPAQFSFENGKLVIKVEKKKQVKR